MLSKKNFLRLKVLTLGSVPIIGMVSCTNVSMSDIGLVTDAGSIFDRSFNQSAWEGILKVQPQASESLDAIKPERHNPSNFATAYSVLVASQKKFIVAPGFYHFSGIKDWNNEGFKDYINFILLDAILPENPDLPYDPVNNPSASNVASVIYETAAAGFLAGYLSSLFLNAKKDLKTPGYYENNKALKIGMWGGGDFPGVTDFMVGLTYGVKYFNDNNKDKQAIKFAKFNTSEQYTDAGFASGAGADKAQFLLETGAQILFPVAGPQIADAITAIEKTALKTQKVIGVDSDGTIKFAEQKDYFVTSILKNLTDTVAQVYLKITGKQAPDYIKGLGEVTVGTIDNQLTSITNDVQHGAWDGISNAQQFYDQSTSKTIIDKALEIVKNKTWNDALTELEGL